MVGVSDGSLQRRADYAGLQGQASKIETQTNIENNSLKTDTELVGANDKINDFFGQQSKNDNTLGTG